MSEIGQIQRWALLFLVTLLVPTFARVSYADTCSAVFPGGVQAHSANGFLEIRTQSQIKGSGTTLKVPRIVDGSGSQWPTCGSAKCSATGAFNSVVNYTIPGSTGASGAINIPDRGQAIFPAGNYTNVDVGMDASLTFSTIGGKYHINRMKTNFRSKLTFAPGDYYIHGNLTLSENTVSLTGNQPVRIFVDGSVTINSQSSFNHANPANLLIYAKNSMFLESSAIFVGYLYSQTGDITLNQRSNVTGGVSAAGRILLDGDSVVTYSNAVNTADFGPLCKSPPSINGWNIGIGTGAASTCSDFRVSISARDSNNNLLTGYTGTISITTSTNTGIWKKTGIQADAFGNLVATTNDNGQATYTYTAADNGDISLLLDNQHAQALTIRVADGGTATTSGMVTFAANAFVVESSDSLGEDVIAGRSHSFTVKMMTQDISSPAKSCRVATNYSGTNVKMWLTRDAALQTGAAPVITRGPVTLSPPNTAPATDNINLAFSSGIANFTLSASDVGKYRLNIRDDNKNFSGSAISGQSNPLVARPFGIRVSVTGNPGASSETGAVFRAAGEPFTVTVAAVGWQSGDDVNNDGIPDFHNDDLPGNNANLMDNATLVSFGKESPAEGVVINSFLFAPSGGRNPGLSAMPFSSFTVGTASSSTVSFGEVGIIEILARITDSDYLGSIGSNKIIGKSGYVGRFRPDHFRLSGLGVTPACSSVLPFSYLGENFSVSATVTPYGAGGSTVENYKSGFNKFSVATVQSMLSAVDGIGATSLSNRLVSNGGIYSWNNVGVLTAVPNLSISRAAAPDGPFNSVKVGFKPIDTDGVTLRAVDINLDTNNDGVVDSAQLGNSTTRLRYGRLRLDDSYGPETANLPVIFHTEYWNGERWIKNSDDGCTAIALSQIRYPNGAINIPENRTVAIGTGSTTGEYQYLDAASVGFRNGDAGHHFSAPGAGNTGSVTVQVDLTSYPWLRFDWNNDGNYNDSAIPHARFTFGNYRGHDRILYWNESFR